MKKSSLFLFLLFPVFLFSQQKKSVYYDQNWIESISKYSQFYVCEYMVSENGAYNGAYICYEIVSEKKIKLYNFKNNKLEGEIKEFHPNGVLKLQAFYNNGIPIMEWKEWNADGELVVNRFFDKNREEIKKTKQQTEYEKMYFGEKEFQAPVYGSSCIIKTQEKEKYNCSELALLEYYNRPPLPPSYFNKSNFKNNIFKTSLKYLVSQNGKVLKTIILSSCGDEYLDDLAKTHVLNMIPFEAAKEKEIPIEYWLEAEIIFNF